MISDYHVVDIDENSIGFLSLVVTVEMNVLHKFLPKATYFTSLLSASIS